MTTIARAALPFLLSPPLLSSVSSPPLPSPSSSSSLPLPSPSSSSFPPLPSPSSSSFPPLPSSCSLLRPLSSWPVPPDVGLCVPPVPAAAGRRSSGQGPFQAGGGGLAVWEAEMAGGRWLVAAGSSVRFFLGLGTVTDSVSGTAKASAQSKQDKARSTRTCVVRTTRQLARTTRA